MNLGCWANGAWANGSWVPESWGLTVHAVLVQDYPVAYWRTHKKKRLTKEELAELVRQQRIELGILPPDLPGQAIAEPQDIVEEVAAAVNNVVQMYEMKVDYSTIYKAAYLEAELAIAEYRKEKTKQRKRKHAAALLLMH